MVYALLDVFFFFKQKTAYEMRSSDWSSDVCSSDLLQTMRDARELPGGIVAFAALDDPDVDALLAAHARHGGVRGIRHIVNWQADPARTYTPRDVTQDAAWQRGYSRLAQQGLSFDLQCYPGQMEKLAPLVARHTDVAVIVNHLGMPVASDPAGVDAWRQEIGRAAFRERVCAEG